MTDAKDGGFHLTPDESPWMEAPDSVRGRPVILDPDAEEGNRLTLGRRATLILVSGGMDSVYSLAALLKETDDDILVHHLNLVTAEKRHAVETVQLRRIVEILRNRYRPFHYREGMVDRRGYAVFTPDLYAAAFEGALAATSYQLEFGRPVERWTMGVCREEREEEMERPRYTQGYYPHLFNLMRASAYPYKAPRYFELPVCTKRQEVEYLDRDVVELVWTCSLPVHLGDGRVEECGKCSKCRIMKDIRSDLELSPPTVDPQAVRNFNPLDAIRFDP